LLAFCFLAFVGFGMVLVLVGANQQELASALDLSLAQTGLLSSALALGIGVGVVAAGPLFDRFARRPLFLGFLGASAIVLLTVDAGMSFERWLLQLLLTGFAVGGYDTLINAAIAQRYMEDSTRPMSLAHAGASVGAMLGPIAMGWLAAHWSWETSFHATGIIHAVLAIAALGVSFPEPQPQPQLPTQRSRAPLGPLAPFALVAFAYVGIEACLTVFAVPYADTLGLAADRGRLAISAVWLGLFVGRIGILALPGVLDARTLALSGALGALMIGASVTLAISWIEAVFFAIGLALGCVYPLMIALTARSFPNAEGTAAGRVAGFGALGGFVLPWFTGALGDASGLAVALGSLAFWSLAIAGAMRIRR
jgi:fucose permease